MLNTKVDRVYVLNKETQVSVKIFPITELQKAEEMARELTEYHQKEYVVKVKNEYVLPNGAGFNCRESQRNWYKE